MIIVRLRSVKFKTITIALFFLYCIVDNVDALPPFLKNAQASKAETMCSSLTLEQKIGQMFMISVPLGTSSDKIQELAEYVQCHSIGGIFLSGRGTAQQQVNLVSILQNTVTIPLFVGQDLEWGLAMRLDNVVKFPYAVTLGAVTDNVLIYKMARHIGRQCKLVGVNFNAAPVVDIHSNPNNPVIGFRSFAENKEIVAAKAKTFIAGLQDERILACAKHFPGHGDTCVDSHKQLPIINKSFEELVDNELFPFKCAITDDVGSIMVGHLHVPALDTVAPASLSYPIVTKLLKQELGFEGLVITDALAMQAITNSYSFEQANLQACLAGNDILLYASSMPESVQLIKQALHEGKITEAEIDRRVIKILRAKKWLGLFDSRSLCTNYCDVDTTEASMLKEQLYRSAIEIIEGEHVALTVDSSCMLLQLGRPAVEFEKKLLSLLDLQDYTIDKLNTVDALLITLCLGPRETPSKEHVSLIKNLKEHTIPLILVFFGMPWQLKKLPKCNMVVLAYEDDSTAQQIAAEILLAKIARLVAHEVNENII